jgi:glycosyltransferase involved in cell wall biosynthesis
MSQLPFKVSIIIPVFNAVKYVTDAVESVLALNESGEILLVDDGSSDGSLSLCQRLAEKYPSVKVFQHSNKKNNGPAATRNVGIKNASYEYISFLDADDQYLSNRFTDEKLIFENQPDVEAVYGFSLTTFLSEEGKATYYTREENNIYTLTEKIPPENLFRALLFYGYGRLHTSAITIRKTTLERIGLFNENLKWAEDTDMWLRLAMKAKMVGGSIETPISHRRIHNSNMVHQHDKALFYKNNMYNELFVWALNQNSSFEILNNIQNAHQMFTEKIKLNVKIYFWLQIKTFPQIVFTRFFWKKLWLLYFVNRE